MGSEYRAKARSTNLECDPHIFDRDASTMVGIHTAFSERSLDLEARGTDARPVLLFCWSQDRPASHHALLGSNWHATLPQREDW